MNATAGIPSTRDRILDIAQRLIQSRGYNAFSFNDLAKELRIRTASVHYHFPTKADLGVALLRRYRQRFRQELDFIAASGENPMGCLAKFTSLFERTFKTDNQLCLCGMLSAEAATLPKQVASEVARFFSDTELWLAKIFTAGKQAQLIAFKGSPRAQARMLIAMLEGAMVVARGMRHRAYFQDMARSYLVKFSPS
jgi:TetR/AcrR family transcriptional regulator, transcriptional repressor for nem operon